MKTNLYPYLKPLYRFLAAGVMVLIMSDNLHAQHWALPSSRWEYTLYQSGLAGPGYLDYGPSAAVMGDTMVAGTTCRKIAVSGSNSIGLDSMRYGYESGDTAFLYVHGAFRPFMYFHVQTGDTVELYEDTAISQSHLQPERHAVVRGIDSIAGGRDTLRRFTLQIIDSGFENYFDYVYAEKLGVLSIYNGFFYPSFDRSPDGNTISVCNYGDSTIIEFWFYPSSRCDINIGLKELRNKVVILCRPNPSTGTFTIDLPMTGSKSLHIYDVVGRIVWVGSTDDQSETVQLSHDGLYMVEVVAGERRYRSKILIE